MLNSHRLGGMLWSPVPPLDPPLMLPQVKTQAYGENSITFRGSILWNALTDDIKLVIMWQHSKGK